MTIDYDKLYVKYPKTLKEKDNKFSGIIVFVKNPPINKESNFLNKIWIYNITHQYFDAFTGLSSVEISLKLNQIIPLEEYEVEL